MAKLKVGPPVPACAQYLPLPKLTQLLSVFFFLILLIHEI